MSLEFQSHPSTAVIDAPHDEATRYSWAEKALLFGTTTIAVALVSVISVLLRLS